MRPSRETVHHPDESMRCMQLELAEFRGELHRHHHLELTWIQRGRGLRWVGDSVEPFVDGDLVLVGGDTAHLWSSYGEPSAQACAATVLQFPPDWARRTGLPELAGISALLAKRFAGLEVQGHTRGEVQRLLAQLRGASAVRRVAVFIDVLGALQEGSADLRVLSVCPPEAPPAERGLGAGPQRMDRVVNWIQANLAQDLRVADAAAVAHVSSAAFARFFRREVGKSFTQYVNDARCGWAALELAQGREPIAQIAQACGFHTLSNFGEQFRRRHGLSPRDFRATHRVQRSP
jgi:AraC-like DNA-binding protein/mannose-6-phosphate isomerase-like protein (cupin superfamily)